MEKQSNIILACMALHNLIQDNTLSDQDFDKCDEDENYIPMPAKNPFEQNADNNQIGHANNMNSFHNYVRNALMCEVE
jgi:hypothetical protein